MSNKKENYTTLEIDVAIGKKLRFLRKKYNLTQNNLADLLGVTYQQVQKYESGKNRILASKLFYLSEILKIPMEYFFEFDEEFNENDNPEEEDISLAS